MNRPRSALRRSAVWLWRVFLTAAMLFFATTAVICGAVVFAPLLADQQTAELPWVAAAAAVLTLVSAFFAWVAGWLFVDTFEELRPGGRSGVRR